MVRPGVASQLGLVFSERARTFAFAARLLPREQFDATVALYAFFRMLDDLVDESPFDVERKRELLDGWRGWLAGGAEPPRGGEQLAAAVSPVFERYAIPIWVFEAFLDGMATDLETVRLQSFEELYRYAFQVAGTVGIAMAHVLGATTPDALRCAVNLGVAMQLTNILRDVGSDLTQDRIYLPADELATFGYSSARLFELWRRTTPQDEPFRALIGFQSERARAYYARGLAGVTLLPPNVQPAILVAGRLYRMILAAIARDRAAPLHRRAATSLRQKIQEAVFCMIVLRWRMLHPSAAVVGELSDPMELGWWNLVLNGDQRPVPAISPSRPEAA